MDKELVKEWFRLADLDLDCAQKLNTFHPQPFEVICFHCQQAAKKYLKGYLAAHNVESPKTHDLEMVCRLCLPFDPMFGNMMPFCIYLSEFGVLPRYPFEIAIDEYRTSVALNYAEKIKKFEAISALREQN